MFEKSFEFKKSLKALKDLGIDELEEERKIAITDVQGAFQAGQLIYDEKDGSVAYLDQFEEPQKGYLYKRKVWLTYNGKKGDFPKKHIFADCEHLRKMKEENKMHEYEFTNKRKVPVYDRGTGKSQEHRLDYCNYCLNKIRVEREAIFGDYLTILEKEGITDWRDMYGYMAQWEERSKIFRQKHWYTCQSCGFKGIDKARKYIHTHHKDRDKANNEEENLQCLCILCHANVDSLHQKNFKGSKDLETFVNDHNDILEHLKNPYL